MPTGTFYPQVLLIPSVREDATKIIPTANLIAHWKMENVNDSWFNGFNLTNNSSVTFRNGLLGKCAKANGTTSYLSRASDALMNPQLNSFYTFIRFRGIKSTAQSVIFAKFTSPTGYIFTVNNVNGIVTASVRDDANGCKVQSVIESEAVTKISNLVALYRFEDDVSDGYGINGGTVTGTTTYIAGRFGKGFSFNGSTRIDLANEGNFDREYNQAMSICTTINFTSTVVMALFSKGSTPGYALFANQSNDGRIYFYIRNTAIIKELRVRTTSSFNDGINHTVVVTKDTTNVASGVKIYVDGVSQTLVTVYDTLDAVPTTSASVAKIGAFGDDTSYYTGMQDEVRFYTKELTAAEALSYHTMTSVPVDYLDGKWHNMVIDANRGNNLSMYVDSPTAINAVSMSHMNGNVTNTSILTMFANATPGQFWDGELDEVRFYVGAGISTNDLKALLDTNSKKTVGIEERGGSLVMDSSEERSRFTMAFNGKDNSLKKRYDYGGNVVVLHHRIPMSGMKAMWNFQRTLDDESINQNDLVITSTLISRHRFENNAQDSYSDAHGKWYGTEAYTPSSIGLAASFNGTSYIILEKESKYDFDRLTPFSVKFKLKTSDASATGRGLITKAGSNAFAGPGWNVRLNITHNLAFTHQNTSGTNLIVVKTNITVNDGAEHEYVVTYSGSSTAAGVKIYQDGVDLALTTVNDTLSATTLNDTPVVIGGFYGVGGAGSDMLPSGYIDGVEVYTGVLGQATVTGLKDFGVALHDDFFLNGGGLAFDGITYYSTPDNGSQTFDKFTIFGRMTIPAVVSGDPLKQIFVKGLDTTSPISIFVFSYAFSPNTVGFNIRNAGGATGPTYVFTPNVAFNFALVYDGTTMSTYINGVYNAGTNRSAPLVQNYSDLYIGSDSTGVAGASIVKANTLINHLHYTTSVLTASQVSDLATLQIPSLSCIFDGTIISKPTTRESAIPFSIQARDFLLDRLSNDDLTAQFAGITTMGQILKTAVARSSLVDYFDTQNVDYTDKKSNGKYFIREQLINVFRWVTDAAGTEFYSERRGLKRYLHHHLEASKHSGLTLQPTNILLPYSMEPEIRTASNIIQVEGGVLKTVEEQMTFDNGTTKASNTLYYAIKSTPEFILYGQLELLMAKVGSPGDLHIELREDKGGDPLGPHAEVLTSVEIPAELVPRVKAYVPIAFDATLSTSKTYWLVIEITGDATNNYLFSDNGGVADTNMKTSALDVTWAAVGYTFDYKLSHKDKVVSTAKKSSSVDKIGIRKLTFADKTITDKETARQISRGLLAKLGDDQIHFSNVKVKNIDIIPQPKLMVSVVDTGAEIDDDYKIQRLVLNLTPGKNGIIDRFILDFGDESMSAESIFQQFTAQMRNSLQADEPPITDTMSFGEQQSVALLITGLLLTPVTGTHNVGIQLTGELITQLPKTDMLWDTDDIGGYDPDNDWEIGVSDADNL